MTVRVRRTRDDLDRPDGSGRAVSDAGVTVLVDRLWPRGLAKRDTVHDAWEKTVAPSTGLRKWFSHDPQRYEEFARRYRAELEDSPEAAAALERLRGHAARGPLTLLTATRDPEVSHARVLADVLDGLDGPVGP